MWQHVVGGTLQSCCRPLAPHDSIWLRNVTPKPDAILSCGEIRRACGSQCVRDLKTCMWAFPETSNSILDGIPYLSQRSTKQCPWMPNVCFWMRSGCVLDARPNTDPSMNRTLKVRSGCGECRPNLLTSYQLYIFSYVFRPCLLTLGIGCFRKCSCVLRGTTGTLRAI